MSMQEKNVQRKCLIYLDNMITIFTPTYNRAHLLPRLYTSLCEQTCGDFEWLIVDDGSMDNTEEVVASWIDENKIPIRYYHKNNGGKHRAINWGMKLAKGELFFIADSDDFLPKTSIATVIGVWNELTLGQSDNSLIEFGGICGLDGDVKGNVIGSGLPADFVDATYTDIRNRYKVLGDMKEIYLTKVLKEFPFPEIDGENFCPEALLWNRISQKYKLRYFNKIIYIVEYQENGVTAGIIRARMKCPIATMMTYSEWFECDISLRKKIRMAINYWRFAFCATERPVKITSWGNLFAPLGWLMHMNDKRKLKL